MFKWPFVGKVSLKILYCESAGRFQLWNFTKVCHLLTALIVQSTAGHAHNQFTCMLTCRHVHTMNNDTISLECPHLFYTQEHCRHKLFLCNIWEIEKETGQSTKSNSKKLYLTNKQQDEGAWLQCAHNAAKPRHYRHHNSTMSNLIQYNMSPQLAHFIQPPVLFETNLNENTVV